MTGSCLTTAPIAAGAVCITKLAAGAVRGADPFGRLQVLSRRDRYRPRLGRRDVRVADIPHQHPAARHLVGPDIGQRRFLDLAPIDSKGTSRVELAPRWRVGEVGWQPLDADQS